MSVRSYFLATTALGSLGAMWFAVPGAAAPMSPAPSWYPAVSGINFKIDGFGGWADATGGVSDRSRSGGLGGSSAALTVPIGQSYGLQVDGLGGSWGGKSFWGAGGHGFWRDPNVGLLGIVGSWTTLNTGPWQFLGRGTGVDVVNIGAEGEYYWNAVTLRGVAGWEGGDVTSRFFTRLDARWYAQQDLMLSIGYRYTGGLSALALGTEWLTSANVFGGRASLFAEARVGEGDYRAVLGGLRIYFGNSQTLIDKHRRDDPSNDTTENLFTLQSFSNTLDINNKNAQPTSTSIVTSDIRLKRDIVLLARLDNGIGLYRYRYIWDDTLYVGVMAQEVMAIVPQAVRLWDDGYLRVDYGRLGLRLTTWDQWERVTDAAEIQAAA